jgi:hypothetical protein
VQAVDVLGNQAKQLPALLEIADCIVADVRLNSLEEFVGRFF